MNDHPARYPGISNDPAKYKLSERQAARLSESTPLLSAELSGKTLAELYPKVLPYLDPRVLFFRKICGRVVKADPDGGVRPVPFATVNVYDTDINLLAWSPSSSSYSWFFPLGISREKIASVTTDECGRFCVWVPRFELDRYLRWRLERHCYLEWLRKPVIRDVLRELELVPQPRPGPDPAPLRLDEHMLAHASRVLPEPVVGELREVSEKVELGARRRTRDAVLTKPAFGWSPPPLTDTAEKLLQPDHRAKLAARAGVPVAVLEPLRPRRVFGPFLRCHYHLVPEWTTVLDIPDLTFEVTQDVDGDGDQEVIYSEGLFDVRWDDTSTTDVTLYADPIAIAGPTCDLPDLGPCGDPAILHASNYPLQATSAPSDFHDASSGYAKLPNRPDADGLPNGPRIEPAQAPLTGNFYLVGCSERPGATHYRVHHQVDGGPTSYLGGSFGPLTKVVGGVLLQRVVSPVDGQWYPIVPRADGWTPVGILAPVSEGGNRKHTFRLEFGTQSGSTITPVPGSQTAPVNLHIDAEPPTVEFATLEWRQPLVSSIWQALSTTNCPVMARQVAGPVQVHLRVRVTANHLRNFAVTAGGCGSGISPQLLPAFSDEPAHWHMGPGDNTHVRDLYYELPADAPAGCYRFAVYAASRAFKPTTVVDMSTPGITPEIAWRTDLSPVWVNPHLSVALQ